MTARVPLNQEFETQISLEDLGRVSAHRWFVAETTPGKFYAMRAIARGKTLYLHRFVLGAERGQIVDHINGDGLDNRRENLRFADATLNCVNRHHHKSISGFRGVYPTGSRWYAALWARRKKYHLGRFDAPEDAARAYDLAAREHFGDFAVLNFPAGCP